MKYLSTKQRYTISVMKEKGNLQSLIAETIGEDKSTISRELHCNCDERSGKYRHGLAQHKCYQRHELRPKRLRFIEDVKAYVDAMLSKEYSPE